MEGPTGKPAHEAQLINAPVVHGYRMTVLSPITAMLLRTNELGRFDAKRQIDVVRRIAPIGPAAPRRPRCSAGWHWRLPRCARSAARESRPT